MDEPMVTIPLREYDMLRDKANNTTYLQDRVNQIEYSYYDLQKRVFELEEKNRRVQ